jgi:DNA-binding CsgD family transcriptional regulator
VTDSADSAQTSDSGQRAPAATGFADSNLDLYRDAPGNAPSLHLFLMRMLDEIDYGMVLLDHRGHIWHANHLARAELGKGQLLHTDAGHLCTRVPGKQADLQQAITRAGQGTRSMLDLRTEGPEPTGTSLAIVPMGHSVEALNGPLPVLIITSRQVMCEEISLQFFAKSFGLTGAERAILSALVQGQEVDDIAESRQLAVSTVRTQIKQLRTKTRSNSIRELLGKVSTLPPVVSSIKAF